MGGGMVKRWYLISRQKIMQKVSKETLMKTQENANGSYEKTNKARRVKICVWQPWTFPYTMH